MAAAPIERPSQLDLDAIRFGSYFKQLQTSAEFASAIDDLTDKSISARKRRADLLIAEENALVGQGDLAAIRAELAQCEEDIATFEKQINGAQRRRDDVAKQERLADLEEAKADAKAKADALSALYGRAFSLIEDLRGVLFEVDTAVARVHGANSTLGHLEREDLQVNLIALLSRVASQPKQAQPNRLTLKGVKADRILCDLLSAGGPLDHRAGYAPLEGAITSNFRPAASRGA